MNTGRPSWKEYEDNISELETAMLGVRDRHQAQLMQIEFDSFMKKLGRLSHEQRVTLYNALVERLAVGE